MTTVQIEIPDQKVATYKICAQNLHASCNKRARFMRELGTKMTHVQRQIGPGPEASMNNTKVRMGAKGLRPG